MILTLLCFYIIAFILSVRYPSYFVVYYVLASTKFLGFIDPSSFIIGGIEIGYFGLNIIAIISVFFKDQWYIIPRNIKWFIYFIILILLYGIIKPYLDNNSSLLLAFIASKDIWFYFLLVYLIIYRNEININLLLKTINRLGVYLSFIYIFGLFIPEFIPHFYYSDSYIRVFFPTYISLAIFIYAYEIKFSTTNQILNRLIILVLFMGLFLASHLSLTIMTIVGFLVYIFVFDKKLTINRLKLTRFSIISSLVIALILLSNEAFYKKITMNVQEIISGENTSLSARDIYNEFRWEAINKQKNFGYGFIHQSSDYMKNIKTYGANRFMERFTVIDSGYVDLLIKYGYVGTIIILLIFIKFHFIGFLQKNRNPISVAMSIYLAQYLFINYTWSVYSFAHGIIPGAIAFYLLFMSIEPKLDNINPEQI